MEIENADPKKALESADVVIFGLGYEPRCTFIASLAHDLRQRSSYAIGYAYSKHFRYEQHARDFRTLGVEVLDDVDDAQYSQALRDIVQKNPDAIEVVVDISALNRGRMASCVEVLLTEFAARRLSVSFAYASGKFVPPSQVVVQNQFIGPVSAAFSGHLDGVDLPAELIVGLGYETGKALGAVEYLQSTDFWLFLPTSAESRFEREVRQANEVLMALTRSAKLIPYRVEDPAGTYADVKSVLRGMAVGTNPMLLPLGPKIFALVCLLIAAEDKRISVWRASQGRYEVALPREAAGDITVLRAVRNDGAV